MMQTTLGRWSQRLLTLAGLFCLFYLFLVLIQPYRFSKVLAEKRGRVVDAQTGKGLPGVAVIVNYVLWSSTPMQTGYSGCIHQKIAWTDADGSYVIPNASKDIDVAEDMLWRMLPGFSRNYGWMLDYYKEGYVEKQYWERMTDLVEKHPNPRPGRSAPYAKHAPSYFNSPAQKWIDPPVQMQWIDATSSPTAADAHIASVDDSIMFLRCYWNDERNTAESLELRAEIRKSIRKLICDLPPDKILIDRAISGDYYDCASTIGINKIIGAKEKGDSLPTTGDLCEAFNYIPNEYECQDQDKRIAPRLELAPSPGGRN